MMASVPQLREEIERRYRSRTTTSLALYERGLACMPGADTRTVTYYKPYPTYMARGNGSRLHDMDGNAYVDLVGNYTSLIHGHAHPVVVRAIEEQVRRGTAFGAPVKLQIELAEALSSRIPSIQLIRFTNSGTEAVQGALRVARAYTGRSKVMKFEGGYHGSSDIASISVDPGEEIARWPSGRPDGPGISDGTSEDLLVAPYNHPELAVQLIRQFGGDLAAVIVEPMLGSTGMIPAELDFLTALRQECTEVGALLIFDEVITFRLDSGGAQHLYGVTPDLTALGKVVGGGLPVGAFGGREDVMALYDPRRAGALGLSGTYSGNAATLAAGLATLTLLTPEAIAEIGLLGDRLRSGLRRVGRELNLPTCVTGMGSLSHLHLTNGPIRDYRSALPGKRREVRTWLHLALLNQGIFAAPRGMFIISTATTQSDVDNAIAAVRIALDEVAGLIREQPALVSSR